MTVLAFMLLIVVGIVAFLVSNEGVWGAALTLLCTIFSGILAMNVFEPLAAFFQSGIPSFEHFWDFIALTGVFGISVFLMRLATDQLAPTSPEVPALVYDIGRFGFALMTGYVTMAFLLTALHTAPIGREVAVIGFKPEADNFFGVAAPDRQWLAFNQYFSEKVMGSQRIFDGPQFAVSGVEKQFAGAKKGTWPSFPIRYAARREDYPPKKAGLTGGKKGLQGSSGSGQTQQPQPGPAAPTPPAGAF